MLLVWILLSVLTITFARNHQIELQNVVTVPTNCQENQTWVDGQCRDTWSRSLSTTAAPINAVAQENDNNKVKIAEENENLPSVKNIISVPGQCPDGYMPDALGYCRKIFESALI